MDEKDRLLQETRMRVRDAVDLVLDDGATTYQAAIWACVPEQSVHELLAVVFMLEDGATIAEAAHWANASEQQIEQTLRRHCSEDSRQRWQRGEQNRTITSGPWFEFKERTHIGIVIDDRVLH